MKEQEPWLSGPVEGVHPMLMPAAHALAQCAGDLLKAARDLTNEELWAKPGGAPAVGFHLRHIAGSIDRLLTYARGESLSPEQFEALAAEERIEESIDAAELARKAVERIEEAINAIRATPEQILFEKRTVGRKKLPTNVFGLLFHIAEHTQRHTGQAITTAKIIKGRL